jgi:hypothetical protein
VFAALGVTVIVKHILNRSAKQEPEPSLTRTCTISSARFAASAVASARLPFLGMMPAPPYHTWNRSWSTVHPRVCGDNIRGILVGLSPSGDFATAPLGSLGAPPNALRKFPLHASVLSTEAETAISFVHSAAHRRELATGVWRQRSDTGMMPLETEKISSEERHHLRSLRRVDIMIFEVRRLHSDALQKDDRRAFAKLRR